MPKTLYRYILDVSGRRQIWLTAISIAVFLLAMVPLELQRRIVNGAIKSESIRSLALLVGLYVLYIVINGALKYLMNMERGRIGEISIRALRRKIREGGRRSHGDEDRDNQEGAVVAMVSAEVEPLGGFVGISISQPVVQFGSLAAIFGYLLWVEPLIAAVAIGLFVPQLLFVPRLQRAINARAKARIEILREVGDLIVEEGDGDDGATPHAPKGFDAMVQRVYALRMEVFRLKYLMKLLINMINHLGVLSVLCIGGWMVINGRTEVGTIVAFLTGLQRVSEPGRELVRYFRQVSDARVKYGLVRNAFV